MKIIDRALNGVLLLEPEVFGDDRGYFFESFNSSQFEGLTGVSGGSFVQDNHSMSHKGVLRGIHYQLNPKSQGKLVRVCEGEVFDVAVDLRTSSPSFGRWFGAVLSGQNRRQLWVPEGFGHGFLTLADHTHFLYKTTNFYSKEHERSVRWNDKEIAIEWPLAGLEPTLSEKDELAPSMSEAETFR